MSKKPVLVIMAAGMGSRYGGLKQIDPIDGFGNLIIDFSIYDAKEAGFEKVVFIIKKVIEEDFKEKIGNRIAQNIEVAYAYQEVDKLPEGFSVPEGREKPWGTGHAILCAAEAIDGAPFAVINADDYYGKSAFRSIYQYLEQLSSSEYDYAMVAYDLYKTLTENGHVARGVCTVDENGKLQDIVERTKIEKHGTQAEFSEDDGASWTPLAQGTLVSMNLWGFHSSILIELQNRFADFLTKNIPVNPLKCEYFLPFVVDELLKEGKAAVEVLRSADNWYGVTYKEDKQMVMDAIQAMKDKGDYPDKLWDNE